MGIKDLFDLSANLSGILPGSTARVSSVLHNAKIEVNEVGTVAAAVTGKILHHEKFKPRRKLLN